MPARFTARALVALASFAGASGSASAGACTYNLEFLTPSIQQFLDARPSIPGAVVVILKSGVPVYQRVFGTSTVDQVVPIASATKWPTSALIAKLAEEGAVNLDDPVGLYIPEFNVPEYAGITLRRCISHTAGLPGQSEAISRSDITLEQSAQMIAAEGLRARPGGAVVPPGTDFCYGGVSMQVAGRVAEIVGAAPYAEFLTAEIFAPLGMTSTGFGTLQGANPRIAGGLSSSASDYLRFLTCMLNGGVFRGQRVFESATIAEILADQTFGVPITCSPAEQFNPGSRYGLGTWRLQPVETEPDIVSSSPGAFGCVPWIDPSRAVAGIFLISVANGYSTVAEFVNSLQGSVANAIDAVTPLAGDANLDGVVGLADIATVIAQWSWEAGIGDAGDIDRDGEVGLSDLAAILNHWGTNCP